MLPSWAIILIILGVLLICYFALGFLFHHLMVKAKARYIEELKKMEPYEENRGKQVYSVIEKLVSNGYKFDPKAEDMIKRGGEDYSSLSYEEMVKYKNTIDFTSLFLAKVAKEDKKYGKLISKEEAALFENMRYESEKVYKDYNKAASKFNVYQNMIFTRGIMTLRREPKVNAPII